MAPLYMKFVDRIGVSDDHMTGNQLFLNQQIRLPYNELELLMPGFVKDGHGIARLSC